MQLLLKREGASASPDKRERDLPMKENQSPEKARKNYIVESNSLAQTKQNDLTAQQMKIALFFISKIRMDDDGTKDYEATIHEICDVCGVDRTNGFYYVGIKNDLIKMTQREWVRIKPGVIATISWFSDIEINEGSGRVVVHFHEKLWPELFNLRKNFTKFELGEVLPFKSKYAIRLYQILISKIMGREERQLGMMQTVEIEFDAEELQMMLNAMQYKDFAHFKQKALLKAIEQINKYSEEIRVGDIITESEGRKVKWIVLPIRYTHAAERLQAKKAAREALNRQKRRKTKAAE